jgi:5-methylcytosine-specific restriction endonuclease McrA
MSHEEPSEHKAEKASSSGGYRKRALIHYAQDLPAGVPLACVVCGFGISAVLEIAHINQDRGDNTIDNLAVLCPTCHKMYDIGLIPIEAIKALQKRSLEPNWKLRIKDAGAKAAATRALTAAKKKKAEAGKKAWATRLGNVPTGDA